jgi:hypothetical protein
LLLLFGAVTHHEWVLYQFTKILPLFLLLRISVCQVGIFQVLYLGRSADESYAPLRALQPFTPFRDASCGVPTFNLMPIDCLRVSAQGQVPA